MPPLFPPLPKQEVVAQGLIQRVAGIDQNMICTNAQCRFLQRVDMGTDALRIGVAHELRCNFDRLAGFEIFQQDIAIEFRIKFLLIEYVEEHNILPIPGEWTDARQ